MGDTALALPVRADLAPARDRAAIAGERHLPGVHGLRALAAGSIIVFHLGIYFRPPATFAVIEKYFGLGVTLFFVISGYSLTYSYYSRRADPAWIQKYLIKRVFRIAPLFYAILLATLILFYFRHVKISLADIVLNVTFAFNFVPGHQASLVFAGWTIGVEMIFYALMPVVLSIVKRLPAAICLFLIAVSVSWAARSPLADQDYFGSIQYFFVFYVGIFAAGVAGFFIFASLKNVHADSRGVQLIAFIIFLALFGLSMSDLDWLSFQTVWAVAFTVLCIWQSLVPGWIAGSKLLGFVGERSYSLYLLHPLILILLAPLIEAIKSAGMPDSVAYVLSAVVTVSTVLIAACLTYALIEAPFMALGSRIARRATTRRSDASELSAR